MMADDRREDRQSRISGEDRHAKLIEVLTKASKESNQKILSQLPKVKADNADNLRRDLKDIRRYFDDQDCTDRRVWFKKIRNVVDGA